MFLASTCMPYDQQTVSKIKISGIVLLKDQVNQEVKQQGQCYIHSNEPNLVALHFLR